MRPQGHNYVGHNYVGHDYVGQSYVGHNYVNHNYVGHNYFGPYLYRPPWGPSWIPKVLTMWAINTWAITILGHNYIGRLGARHGDGDVGQPRPRRDRLS